MPREVTSSDSCSRTDVGLAECHSRCDQCPTSGRTGPPLGGGSLGRGSPGSSDAPGLPSPMGGSGDRKDQYWAVAGLFRTLGSLLPDIRTPELLLKCHTLMNFSLTE